MKKKKQKLKWVNFQNKNGFGILGKYVDLYFCL